MLSDRLRTRRAARLLFRAFNPVYRLGRGRILGHRFLQLTHRGRRSGRTYHTVVEVVRYNPATRESVVLSGWGHRSDWFRNIQARSALQITTAGQAYTPVQRFLDAPELYADLCDYAHGNPYLRPVIRRILGLTLDGSARDLARLEQLGYRGVAFRPADARAPAATSAPGGG